LDFREREVKMVCEPLDIACGITESIVNLIVPILIPLIVLLVAIFILPKAGRKGWLLALIVIFGELLWFGLVPGLPALRDVF